MSRAQEGDTFDTAKSQAADNATAAKTSETADQGDINAQRSRLAQFAAENPYVAGGEMETTTDRQLSNTADATANAAADRGQMIAERTGQNPAAAIAAGEAEQQEAQRTLGTAEAGATQSRLAAKAGYGKDVLGEGDALTAEQERLAALQSGAAQSSLSTQQQAAQTPSFMDTLGDSLVKGGVQLATGRYGKP